MKEQGHSQSASLFAHESSAKGGAAFKLHSEFAPTGDQLRQLRSWSRASKKATNARLY